VFRSCVCVCVDSVLPPCNSTRRLDHVHPRAYWVDPAHMSTLFLILIQAEHSTPRCESAHLLTNGPVGRYTCVLKHALSSPPSLKGAEFLVVESHLSRYYVHVFYYMYFLIKRARFETCSSIVVVPQLMGLRL
jgi:hypothetical protein